MSGCGQAVSGQRPHQWTRVIPEALLRASLTLSVALVLSLVLLVPVSAPETLERYSVAALPNLGPPL